MSIDYWIDIRALLLRYIPGVRGTGAPVPPAKVPALLGLLLGRLDVDDDLFESPDFLGEPLLNLDGECMGGVD